MDESPEAQRVVKLVSKATGHSVKSFTELITTGLNNLACLLGEIAPGIDETEYHCSPKQPVIPVRRFLNCCLVLGLPTCYTIFDYELGTKVFPNKMLGIVYIILRSLRHKYSINTIKRDMAKYFSNKPVPSLRLHRPIPFSLLDNGTNEGSLLPKLELTDSDSDGEDEENNSFTEELTSVCSAELKDLETLEGSSSFLIRHFNPNKQPRSHVGWLRNIDAENIVFFYDGTIIKGKDHMDTDVNVALRLFHWLLQYRHYVVSTIPFKISLVCLEAGLGEPFFDPLDRLISALPSSATDLLSTVILTYSCKGFPKAIIDGSQSPGKWADRLAGAGRLGFVSVKVTKEDETSYARLKNHETAQVARLLFKDCEVAVASYPFDDDDDGE